MIPELQAQEQLDEAAIALLPTMKDSLRRDLFRAWTRAARTAEAAPRAVNHDQAWDSLRSIVRR